MMRKIVFLLCLAAASMSASAQFRSDVDRYCPNIVAEQCQWEWSDRVPHEFIPLEGYVYVAKEGEPYDLKIRVARKGETPDMWVGIVKKYPDECGLWQWTDDRKKAWFTVKFVSKVGEEHMIVKFEDGEKNRHNTDLPCWDYSSGKREPCK
ncbi:MAG: hypothetical protein IJR13_04130 [Bacteroidales bacterium]|nr:hypothetical protein [Bacteroidales bacterium]